jgi:hypothetical protein
MANLLPINAQKRVWAMYRSRFILVAGISLFVLAGAAALTLMPSYVALQVAAPPVTETKPSTGDQESAIVLERAHLAMQHVAPSLLFSTSSIGIAEEVLAMRPRGLRVTRVSYQSGDAGRLTLSGDGTRETITSYRDILNGSGKFASVNVTVGALVPAEGGPFTIVVSGAF